MKDKLSIKNIKKVFNTKEGDLVAIEDVSLNVKDGEILAIVGTSGCGKSTLLNIIAGLEEKTDGEITFNKDNPRISYMLQNDALLSFRSVLDNACLGLELLHIKTPENVKKVKTMLKEYGLEDFENKKPSSLSGGMRQRVALVRSLAVDPDILLLDEPFSALDYYTRITISDDVQKMIRKNSQTAIIITHDIQEALSIANRVVVMSSRPSKVKKIYELNFKGDSILSRRRDPNFNDLYESIWRDLDVKI